jgi:hypothetical protein
MSKHDYTPEQALRRLIEKVTLVNDDLGAQVVAAVNAGKDVQETERTGKKQTRFYRHAVPYSPAEALGVALEVLRAHFIERPLFINSCQDNLAHADLLTEKQTRPSDVNAERKVEIELQTETAIIPTDSALSPNRNETLAMSRVSEAEIKQQQDNLQRLCELIDFSEN